MFFSSLIRLPHEFHTEAFETPGESEHSDQNRVLLYFYDRPVEKRVVGA